MSKAPPPGSKKLRTYRSVLRTVGFPVYVSRNKKEKNKRLEIDEFSTGTFIHCIFGVSRDDK